MLLLAIVLAHAVLAFGNDTPGEPTPSPEPPQRNFAILASPHALSASNELEGDSPLLDGVVLGDLFPLALPHPALSGLPSAPGEELLGICETQEDAQEAAGAMPSIHTKIVSFMLSGGSPGFCPEVLEPGRRKSRSAFYRVASPKDASGDTWKIEENRPPKKPALPGRVRLEISRGKKKLASLTLNGETRKAHQSTALGENWGEWSSWKYYETVPLGDQKAILLGNDQFAADHGGLDCTLFAYACGKITPIIPDVQKFVGAPEKPFQCEPLREKVRVLKPGKPLPARVRVGQNTYVWNSANCVYQAEATR